jgi:hypothetical protein
MFVKKMVIYPTSADIDINQPSGRAVTRPYHLPWSSGDDFRLSLKPISAGDRGSIPRGRDFFFALGTHLIDIYLIVSNQGKL